MLDCKVIKIDNEFTLLEIQGEDWEFKIPTDLLPDRHKLYEGDIVRIHFFADNEDLSYLDDESNYGGKIKNKKLPKIKNL